MRDEREETHFDPEFSQRVRGAIGSLGQRPRARASRRAAGAIAAAGAVALAGVLAWSLGGGRPSAGLPVADLQRSCEAEDYAAARGLLASARGRSDGRLLSRWEKVCGILEKESESRRREDWSASLDQLGLFLEAAGGSPWVAREASRRRAFGEREARLSGEAERVRAAAAQGDWAAAAGMLDALAREHPAEIRVLALAGEVEGAAWDAVRREIEPHLASEDWEPALRILRGEAGGAAASGLPATRRRCAEELSHLEAERRAAARPFLPSASQEEKARSLYRVGRGAEAILACPAGSPSAGRIRHVHDAYEAALRSLTTGDFPAAARRFREVLSAEPDAACWYRRSAEEGLSGIAREAGGLLDAWVQSGERHRAAGDLSAAHRLFESVLSIDPGHAAAAAGARAVVAEADRLFEEAYVLKELDPAKARARLSLLDEILPAEHPLREKVRVALSDGR